ncbi:2OG-Fe(II) oxygenase [Limnoraphis robusta Tam1]|uniref:2OG-Fe(II) oxygenase n=1 Tax=Limnoraphis robusta CCNP1315 TaxID=3110306 RepID=A0ABU5U0M9_9CYAN|nr:2OG-Fe(II) oxygenase [Limnoraphis robusta]MEA5497270.1 2OG-Fe(II) oxygenase [Limnoraphis robusta BA-68 BA1]MEA5519688.1 2OG-Fe(II) oxygenase [Limnoraphis robusta CCNP1315]MEA5540155.1 2OG-Fe(II) oxygenase [Limnoraphis robusta Tam1]MEA5544818.1 2OG-Fe(II) oxygenase [Limnoraphis robusta CCNP1324]
MLKTFLDKSKIAVSELKFKVRSAQYSGKLPSLSPDDRQIVDALDAEGVLITSLDHLALPFTPQLLQAIDGLLPEVKSAFAADSPGFTNAKNTYIVRASYDKIAAEYPEIFLWGLQDRLLDIAENYIGLPVAFLGVDLKKDIAYEAGRDVGSKRWHRDGEDCREFKIMIYLSDVAEDTISFDYIPRYLTPSLLEIIYKSILIFKTPYKSIYTDEQMEHFVSSSEWKSCYGPTGTVIFAGTDGIFHRGQLPKGAVKDRLALQYTYTSRQPENPTFCKRHFSQKGLLILKDKLSERQKECVFWYDPTEE